MKISLKKNGIGVGVHTMLTTKINFSLITTTHINVCDKQSKNNWAKQYMKNKKCTDEKYESR